MGENIIFKAITSLHHWNCLNKNYLYVLCWFGQAHIILFYETPKYKAQIPTFSMTGGENCWDGSTAVSKFGLEVKV